LFYSKENSKVFRLGDIVKNFLTIVPIMKNAATDIKGLNCEIRLYYSYHAILTPCCSIEQGFIMLAPLEKVRPGLFKNKYTLKNLTIINKKMPESYVYKDSEWAELSLEAQEEIIAKSDDYQYYDFFVFAEHDSLPPYPLKLGPGEKVETRFYLVDFRKAFRVKCDKIQRIEEPDKLPPESELLSFVREVKLLELSESARVDFKGKLAHFYIRD